jgi:hypothetical protein
MAKFRVYSHYVGCHVSDVEAVSGEDAVVRVRNGLGQFLHEANDPTSNELFIEAFPYVEGSEYECGSGEPAYTMNPEWARAWLRGSPEPAALLEVGGVAAFIKIETHGTHDLVTVALEKIIDSLNSPAAVTFSISSRDASKRHIETRAITDAIKNGSRLMLIVRGV